MARIPLRTYDREIENLISRGQIEEAIAHAKNILKQYPKHIETYRLLGKAFLESQRYSEASDILQRVLSVIPDDFVAQLGMSIIREDEGNLDAAIWHMERAYEVQPFNRAVQDELRRLYGRRDGVEPPRVRLTRGSLVRMYAKGELYPQAIAEIRAALAEDPQRIDLQALLARLYFITGQKAEAAEIASSLIGKMAFCMEANRILMDILPGTTRAEEARTFQRRIYDLDPYAQFISPNAPTSDQVPDQSVMVERVDWQPSMQDSQAPDWARTIGVQWEATKEEELPDWLNTVGGTAASQENSSQDELVPDFMRNAGWSQTDHPVEEKPNLDYLEETPVQAIESEDLAGADIPDWLQAMAPSTNAQQGEEQNDLEWLDELLPPSSAVSVPLDATMSEQPEPAQSELPAAGAELAGLDWLAESTTPTARESETVEDLPDWLNGFATPPNPTETSETVGASSTWFDSSSEELPQTELHTETQPPPAADVAAPLEPAEEVPAWLRDLGIADAPATEQVVPVESAPEADEPPAWLGEDAPSPAVNMEEVPAWLAQERSEPAPEPEEIPSWLSEETTPKTPDSDEIPAWLSQQPPESQPEEEKPAWMSALSGERTPEENQDDLGWLAALGAVGTAAAGASLSEPAQTESPDTQPEVAPIEAEPIRFETGAPQLDESSESSIMEGFTSTAPPLEEETAPVEPAMAADLPDWLLQLQHEDETAGSTETHTIGQAGNEETQPAWSSEISPTSEPDVVSSGETSETVDVDSAMAWLEALAAKQGADPDSLKITSPEERRETPPDWLAEMSTASEEPSSPISPTPEIPSWLAETEAAPSTPSGEQPEWLREADLSLEPEGQPAPQDLVEPEPIPSAELPAWLREASTPDETAPQTSTESDIVAEIPFDQPEMEATVASSPDLTDLDAALAWMEGLASKQGAEEESLKITRPEERTETPPDWLSEFIGTTTASEAATDQSLEDTQPVKIHQPLVESQPIEPAWLAEGQPVPEPGVVETPPPVEAELPAWLAGLEEEEVDSQPQHPIDVPPTTATLPELVDELPTPLVEEIAPPAEIVETDIPISPVEVSAEPQSEEAPTTTELPPSGEVDVDAAMAWLEALAAKQGAEAESLKITAPEDRSETPPEWIVGLTAQSETAEVTITEQETLPVSAQTTVTAPSLDLSIDRPESETIAEEPPALTPQIEPVFGQPEEMVPPIEIAETGADVAQTVEGNAPGDGSVPEGEAEIPDWLLNYEEEQTRKSQTWPPTVETAQPTAQEENVTLWLQRHHPEPGAPEPASATPPEHAIPEWIPSPELDRTPQEVAASAGLEAARAALAQGAVAEAAAIYTRMVQSGQALNEIVQDLRAGVYQHPVDADLWQALGDAYIRIDKVQEALDAYTKAEELLQ